MTGSDIIITEATEQCNTISPPQQLYTSLQTPSQNWTLMFTVEQITSLNTSAPSLFLNISGYGPIIGSPSSGIFWTLSFWFNESGYLETRNSPDHNLTVFHQNPTLSQIRHITLQFIGDIILVFVDGEVSHRYSTLSSRFQSVSEYIVGFGGSDITGELTNIKLYNAQASTNEIYSMYSGSPLAPYRIRPECECPRHYSDTFNFIGGDQNQFCC
ncbi:hypothetical protein EB796_001271 [Bugula neritina]|uniref:Uncharacterized protein n=1 Tax=Bugula neritina TaxID=10212 RepID=A0A7J7KQF8_BUGNE|nr:hypothetical protein EB796_001271 [Bugula neritina]